MSTAESSFGVLTLPRQSVSPSWQELRTLGYTNIRSAYIAIQKVFVKGVLIEIIRDFYQICGLLFTFVALPDELKRFFGNLSFAISVDFGRFVPNQDALRVTVWWTVFVVSELLMAILFVQWQKLRPRPRKDFLLVRTWGMVSTWTVGTAMWTMFIVTCLYQPVSLNALEIVSCSYRWKATLDCPSRTYYLYCIPAIVALITVTLALPALVFRIVKTTVPKIKEYDEEGIPMEYTAAQYDRDLQSDRSPYVFLYGDYDRAIPHFKVHMMLTKLYLAVIAVLLSGNLAIGFRYQADGEVDSEGDSKYTHIKGVLLIVGLVGFMLFAYVKHPFLDRWAERLDILFRVASIITAVCSYMFIVPWYSSAFSGVAIATHVIAVIASVVFLCYSNMYVRSLVQRWRNKAELTMTIEGGKEVPLVFSRNLSVRKYRKHLWHTFWDDLFEKHDAFKPPENQLFSYADTDEMPCYLLNFLGSVGERHRENKELVTDIGRDAYLAGLHDGSEEQRQAVIYAMRVMHGPDTFFGDVTDRDSTGFGCCYIVPFPFRMYFIGDGLIKDGQDVKSTEITYNEILDVVKLNCSTEVVRRRKLREQLRAIALMCLPDAGSDGAPVSACSYEFNEDAQVKSGGQTRDVRVKYSQGYLTVTHDYDSPQFTPPEVQNESQAALETLIVTPGFQVAMHYTSGEYIDPSTGNVCKYDKKKVLGHKELGITPYLGDTEPLRRLINLNWGLVEQGLPRLLNAKDHFRLHIMKEFMHKSRTLSYASWPVVYDNDKLSKEELVRFFTEYDLSNDVVTFLNEKTPIIDMLYRRMEFFDLHPSCSIWCCFWWDVWYCNADTDLIQDSMKVDESTTDDSRAIADALDPNRPTAIMWNPVDEPVLNQRLSKIGLQKAGKGFLAAEVIRQLYSTIADAPKRSYEGSEGVAVVDIDAGINGARRSAEDRMENFFEIPRHKCFALSLHNITDDHEDLRWLRTFAQPFLDSSV